MNQNFGPSIDPDQINPNKLVYPSPGIVPPEFVGIFPVDFILETIIRAGLDWFRTTPDAPGRVFGQLKAPWLSARYGQKKIDEIADYIKKFEIRIVQHYSLIAKQTPCISIQLLEANEETSRAGFEDHLREVDNLNSANDAVLGRESQGYVPIIDNMHIGIHASETPDLVKYIYYLLIYLLSAFKTDLQDRGLMLTTFRATDLSRINEYLPSNVYSRFINFQTFTIAPYKKDDLPIIDEILGLTVDQSGDSEKKKKTDEIKLDQGLGVCDTTSDGG